MHSMCYKRPTFQLYATLVQMRCVQQQPAAFLASSHKVQIAKAFLNVVIMDPNRVPVGSRTIFRAGASARLIRQLAAEEAPPYRALSHYCSAAWVFHLKERQIRVGKSARHDGYVQ